MSVRPPFNFQDRYTAGWLEGHVDLTQLPKMFKKLNETEKASVEQWVKFSMFTDCVREKFGVACPMSG